jgi:hypothetical protein
MEMGFSLGYSGRGPIALLVISSLTLAVSRFSQAPPLLAVSESSPDVIHLTPLFGLSLDQLQD